MSLSHLTVPHLRKAAKLIKKKEGFLARIRKIEEELEALALYGVLPKTLKADEVREKKKTKRVLSPEARNKIAAAQKKRWAAAKKAPAS